MAKPTARRDDRKVGVMVDVGIPHVTAIEHHGVVQQTAAEVYL
jgi:desulfoferrodoxin (superoxide reductase-like protein)